MPSPHPAVTPAAILIAKKYGKSVSKGIVEMDKRIVVLEYAVPSPLNENQIRTKEIREEVHKVRQEQHDPPKPHKEWIISDVDYHVALEYFHFEARPYIHPPQTPDELFEKCKMLKKKIEADKLEERKMQGEYMKFLRENTR